MNENLSRNILLVSGHVINQTGTQLFTTKSNIDATANHFTLVVKLISEIATVVIIIIYILCYKSLFLF